MPGEDEDAPMPDAAAPNRYKFPPNGYEAGVSPWRQILPHFDWLTESGWGNELFGGLREFVALACGVPALAGRFVFPSAVNMSIFRAPDPVEYLQTPMPPRFIVSPHGPAEVRLRYYPAGAEEPAGEWRVTPCEAAAIIAAEFGPAGMVG